MEAGAVMSDRPDMVVPSIEGERWGELGARLTPQQRAAAVDALVGKLATRAMIDPDDLCPHCGATQGVCSDAMSDQRNDPKLPLPEPPERAILLDLIAEVYAAHDRDDLYYTAAARESLMVSATDRAEARLREVTGE